MYVHRYKHHAQGRRRRPSTPVPACAAIARPPPPTTLVLRTPDDDSDSSSTCWLTTSAIFRATWLALSFLWAGARVMSSPSSAPLPPCLPALILGQSPRSLAGNVPGAVSLPLPMRPSSRRRPLSLLPHHGQGRLSNRRLPLRACRRRHRRRDSIDTLAPLTLSRPSVWAAAARALGVYAVMAGCIPDCIPDASFVALTPGFGSGSGCTVGGRGSA